MLCQACLLKDAAQLGGFAKCVGQLVAVQRAPADSLCAPASTDWIQLVPCFGGEAAGTQGELIMRYTSKAFELKEGRTQ